MSRPTYVLGINAFHGDASAALLRDGALVAAVAEERLRRVRHWAGFPTLAIRAVLRAAGIRGDALASVAVGRNPRAHFGRKLGFVLRRRPARALMVTRLRNARAVGDIRGPLAESLEMPRRSLPAVHCVEHHQAHLASAFFASSFDEAACCALDGFGDFVSTSVAVGRGRSLDVLGRVFFPHSLGIMYTAVTQYLGFSSYGDEFKVMALAAHGRPAYVPELRRLVRLSDRGGFELDLRYFRHWSTGAPMEWDGGAPSISRLYTPELESLLGPPRQVEQALTARSANLACSLQAVFEECVFHVLGSLWEQTRLPRVCIAGGCALNGVATGKVRALSHFREVFVPPAAADDGTALGAAQYVWHQVLAGARGPGIRHAYWGSGYDEAEMRDAFSGLGDDCEVVTYRSVVDAARAAAVLIAQGDVVGWYQGRGEWGARALGNRSIVADPRRPEVRERINSRMKGREPFRPFAPSVTVEALDDYFVNAYADPFMTQVFEVRPDKRDVIPAVTHVDGTARVHAVRRADNAAFYELIEAFEGLTGVPVLLNTSLNEHEPIVDTPRQALDCFDRAGLDAMVMGTTLLRRAHVESQIADPPITGGAHALTAAGG